MINKLTSISLCCYTTTYTPQTTQLQTVIIKINQMQLLWHEGKKPDKFKKKKKTATQHNKLKKKKTSSKIKKTLVNLFNVVNVFHFIFLTSNRWRMFIYYNYFNCFIA